MLQVLQVPRRPRSSLRRARVNSLIFFFSVFQRISGLKRYQCTTGLHLGTGSAKCLQPIPLAPILVALTAHPTTTTHLTSTALDLLLVQTLLSSSTLSTHSYPLPSPPACPFLPNILHDTSLERRSHTLVRSIGQPGQASISAPSPNRIARTTPKPQTPCHGCVSNLAFPTNKSPARLSSCRRNREAGFCISHCPSHALALANMFSDDDDL